MSRGHGARALECTLFCVIARACRVPRTQDAYGLQRVNIARVLSVALSYEPCPRPRIREGLTPPVYVVSRSNAISPVVQLRETYFKPCCYSFLIQGKNTCENILQSVLQLGLLQKGAHISLVYCVHRPTDCILPGP